MMELRCTVNVGRTGVGKGVGVTSVTICPPPHPASNIASATNTVIKFLFIIN
jgi:hypothetical protein